MKCEPTVLGLNGSTISQADIITGLACAAKAGFTGYEARVHALQTYAKRTHVSSADAIRESVGLCWLPLNSLEGLFASPPEELVFRMHSIANLGSSAGIREIILVPGQANVGFQRARELLEKIVAVGSAAGTTCLYELIGFPTHALSSLAQAYRLAQGVGVGLVLDTFHLAVCAASERTIQQLPPKSIGLVHLSDAQVTGKAIEELTDDDRVLPGEGGLDLGPILAAVRRTGYTGPVSVEVFHPKYNDLEPPLVARMAFQSCVQALADAGWKLTPSEREESG